MLGIIGHVQADRRILTLAISGLENIEQVQCVLPKKGVLLERGMIIKAEMDLAVRGN